MKKIKEPNLKVIKFESMDVIATSNDEPTPAVRKITSDGWNYVGASWYKSLN